MTVYPLKFFLGPLEITGYGIMMMVGFLMGGWVIQQDLRRRGMNEEYAADIVIFSVIGGIAGAKLWYVALTGEPAALFSRGGLVWYGGFIGGFLAVIINGWRKKVPMRLTLDLAAPALVVGYALGRVGCFLVQDDYGIPTSLPWGMRFPGGLPPSTAANLSGWGIAVPQDALPTEVLYVHPTQLYEAAAMLFVFWLLWRLRTRSHATGWLFGLYLCCAGIERFLVEFLRAKDDRVLGAFTVAQATSITILTIGIIMMARFAREEQLTIPAESVLFQGAGRRP
jgi:phosphatidylglycerol:prolipoprotein diacylglycerol transferase